MIIVSVEAEVAFGDKINDIMFRASVMGRRDGLFG